MPFTCAAQKHKAGGRQPPGFFVFVPRAQACRRGARPCIRQAFRTRSTGMLSPLRGCALYGPLRPPCGHASGRRGARPHTMRAFAPAPAGPGVPFTCAAQKHKAGGRQPPGFFVFVPRAQACRRGARPCTMQAFCLPRGRSHARAAGRRARILCRARRPKGPVRAAGGPLHLPSCTFL